MYPNTLGNHVTISSGRHRGAGEVVVKVGRQSLVQIQRILQEGKTKTQQTKNISLTTLMTVPGKDLVIL